jgi:hypothetical protein
MQPAPASTPQLTPREGARLIRHAAISLLVYSLLLFGGLVAYFRVEPQPWGYASMITLLCVALGIAAGVLVWRVPSRIHLGAGGGVMLLSLARLAGAPFGWRSATLVVITLALLAPVVRAFVMTKT